ncbi:MAG TPA: zf-HC2 domain-containing protein [Rubrobacter sp.]|nr:zf-HC2 domain-containing protein [Rubrobacter sp.]
MSRPGGPRCDPERVFELADGGLSPDAEREARAHVDRCPACRELYEEELRLSACIRSVEVGPTRSVCREVAMALPTRLVGGRILWAGLALALLAAVSLALSLDGTNPPALAVDAVGAFWGFVSGLAEVVEAFLVAAGPALLVAFGVGAVLDLLIAGVVLSVSRRRAREA